ncbi:VanZ family protein [Paenibacillus pectinilyticus]|uniref:VanZ family protein n=1 Tax=Paenibacillus pectinilyticus TaxID=512399 RepID=UPI001FC93C25|nr:VanZ family protein [Paenibacillus pectinilyticus]
MFHHKNVNIMIFAIGIVYALIMLNLLFLRGRYVSLSDHYMYNLVPFRTIQSYIVLREHYNFHTWFTNLFGNIVLFIPIGLLLPVLNRTFLRPILLIITTLGIIFIIEFLQMVTKVGSFDVDDIILNTCGACVGLFLTKLTLRTFQRDHKQGGS